LHFAEEVFLWELHRYVVVDKIDDRVGPVHTYEYQYDFDLCDFVVELDGQLPVVLGDVFLCDDVLLRDQAEGTVEHAFE
jgi:hypothetical protein